MTQPTYLWNPPARVLAAGARPGRAPARQPPVLRRPQLPRACRRDGPAGRQVGRGTVLLHQGAVDAGRIGRDGAPTRPGTQNYHHEMELVVAIGTPGFRVTEADAAELIYGYACGLDMTRRDLQLVARDKGRPWDLGKDVEAVVGRRRDRADARHRARLRRAVDGGERRDATEVRPVEADLEHPRTDRRPVAVLPPAARRPDLHRHA